NVTCAKWPPASASPSNPKTHDPTLMFIGSGAPLRAAKGAESKDLSLFPSRLRSEIVGDPSASLRSAQDDRVCFFDAARRALRLATPATLPCPSSDRAQVKPAVHMQHLPRRVRKKSARDREHRLADIRGLAPAIDRRETLRKERVVLRLHRP